jgi:CRP-like cAMP-binding protein
MRHSCTLRHLTRSLGRRLVFLRNHHALLAQEPLQSRCALRRAHPHRKYNGQRHNIKQAFHLHNLCTTLFDLPSASPMAHNLSK